MRKFLSTNLHDLVGPDLNQASSLVHVKSLGTVHGGKIFLTDELSHVAVEWEGFTSEPQITVPARKGEAACSIDSLKISQ